MLAGMASATGHVSPRIAVPVGVFCLVVYFDKIDLF
jgi:hypothetical protein